MAYKYKHQVQISIAGLSGGIAVGMVMTGNPAFAAVGTVLCIMSSLDAITDAIENAARPKADKPAETDKPTNG